MMHPAAANSALLKKVRRNTLPIVMKIYRSFGLSIVCVMPRSGKTSNLTSNDAFDVT